MKTLMNLLLGFFFIINTSFIGPNSINDKINESIKGSWVSKKGNLQRIQFMDNNLVQITYLENGKRIASQMHYKISEYNKEKELLIINFLQKNLIKEEYELKSKIKFQYKNADLLIMKTNKDESIELYRSVQRQYL